MTKKYKTITASTRKDLNNGEGFRVDYKVNVKGLKAEDLCAFANASGGVIYLGVEEKVIDHKASVGVIVGHDISDKTLLEIYNKSNSCSPSIPIKLYIENSNKNPIIKIYIDEGSNKPYATASGKYLIRDGVQNNPLLPNDLLRIFLDSEVNQFSKRFHESTRELEAKISDTFDFVSVLEGSIKDSIDDISSNMGWAEYKVSDAADSIEKVLSYSVESIEIIRDINVRVKTNIKESDIVDPIFEEVFSKLKDKLKKNLESDNELRGKILNGESVNISLSVREARELDKEDISKALSKAIKELSDGR